MMIEIKIDRIIFIHFVCHLFSDAFAQRMYARETSEYLSLANENWMRYLVCNLFLFRLYKYAL